jgi:hypothetical protein
MASEIAEDLVVDVPLIWQYIGEIIGAFVGAPASDFALLKDIFQHVPQSKGKVCFDATMKCAVEYSVRDA